MRVAADFRDGLAWVVPQEQQLPDNSLQMGLRELYNLKVKSKIPTSFGILVDEQGQTRTSIPVPQAMFPVMARALAENGGKLTAEAEKKLLLTHTRAVRIYKMSATIGNEEWDY